MVKSSPGVSPKPRFGPHLDSTVGGLESTTYISESPPPRYTRPVDVGGEDRLEDLTRKETEQDI